jgi:CelD/BcsL family acetyltransferase involved in cellulose biosynthesis
VPPSPPALSVTGADDPRWRRFLASHSDATLFHHPAWSRALAEAYGYHAFALIQPGSDGTIVAGLPLLELSGGRRGRRLAALPFTDYCPPLATTAADLVTLASNLVFWREAIGAAQLTIHGSLPAVDGVDVVMRAVRHVLPLSCSSRQFLDRISGTPVHRAIKKAQREGVVATLGRSLEDVEIFYRLHLQTRRRQGVPVQPKRFVHLLWTHVISQGLGFFVHAHHDSRPIASALFLAWNGNLIYKFGASDPQRWHLRANNLVMWTAIGWGCDQGYRLLDFGRTDLDNIGLRDFKGRWGAHELPLLYSHVPPVGRRTVPAVAMRAMTRVIQWSPPIVCRVTGELLYGRVPEFIS